MKADKIMDILILVLGILSFGFIEKQHTNSKSSLQSLKASTQLTGTWYLDILI